ncbi:MAG: PaaI family thioesterase [Deltaproteobacteria bacterium]|nr:PaaI family thioesterase [Deltaproteobacteria bacterium]
MKQKAFQDQGSVSHCHGCGPDNEQGLQIKSYWDGDEAVCTWRAQPHHCGASKEVLNGGIIASLIDCHSLNLAIVDAYKRESRPIGSSPKIFYVTASLNINYLKPTPIDKPLSLRASIVKVEGRKTWLRCTLSAEGQVRASGEVLGVRVWREAEEAREA